MTAQQTIAQKLQDSIHEAQRFIKKAHVAMDDVKSQEYYHRSKQLASAKRSSLDLSASLIELRKSLYK